MKALSQTTESRSTARALAWMGHLALALGMVAPAAPAQSAWHVATNGLDDGTHDGQSWTAPLLTISNAVVKASDGDTVLVSNGVYLVTAYINVNKAIIVRGIAGPEHTIVRRDGPVGTGTAHRVFLVQHADALVAGFTITNGYTVTAAANDGAGVLINTQGGTVSNCIIAGNNAKHTTSYARGGGVAMRNGQVVNCRIYGNYAWYGGGVFMTNSAVIRNSAVCTNVSSLGGGIYVSTNGLVQNCGIYSNRASSTGGGIANYSRNFMADNCDLRWNYSGGSENYLGGGGLHMSGGQLRNCLISDNSTSTNGGGIQVQSYLTAFNCTIANNYAGGCGGGLYFQSASTGYVENLICWGNDAACRGSNWFFRLVSGTYIITNSCFGVGDDANGWRITLPSYRGQGNLTNDPMFVNGAAGDYRLRIGSPCINTASNFSWMSAECPVDLDGGQRRDRFTGLADMGCYEYISQGTMFGCW